MAIQKMEEIRNAVEVLSRISDSQWNQIFLALAKEDNNLQVEEVDLTKEEKFEKLTKLMRELGVPAHLKGFYYLRNAICYYMDSKNPQDISVTKKLYPEIAEEYKTTSTRVERAIRHAIEVAWDRGNWDFRHEIFAYTVDQQRGKPTNMEAIAIIADYLKTH